VQITGVGLLWGRSAEWQGDEEEQKNPG